MLYTCFEDLYLHTADDDLAFAVEMLSEVEDEEDTANIYAMCMAYITHTLVLDKVSRYGEGRDLTEALLKADYIEGCECANNVMHILHLNNPDLRKLGTAQFCENYCPENMRWTSLSYKGIHLTGKDAVPECFVRQIEEAVAPWGFCKITMTWWNSHLDWGEDYLYDIDESISVNVYCDSGETCELAIEALNKLHLVFREEE